jgi:hypothetical protein
MYSINLAVLSEESGSDQQHYSLISVEGLNKLAEELLKKVEEQPEELRRRVSTSIQEQQNFLKFQVKLKDREAVRYGARFRQEFTLEEAVAPVEALPCVCPLTFLSGVLCLNNAEAMASKHCGMVLRCTNHELLPLH